MRSWPVLLSVLLAVAARADEPTPWAAPAAAADATAAPAAAAPASPAATARKAPATVLDDRLEVVIDGGGHLREKRTWTVRIDDPAAVSAGLAAPIGLEGASDRDARVLGGYLLLPSSVAAGDTYTLVGTRAVARGPYSGAFVTVPDLPVVRAEVTLKAPSNVPLSVWTGGDGHASYSRSGGRSVRVTWEDAPGNAELVWSTWKDWLAAGERLKGQVQPLLAPSRESLGRQLASDLSGISVASVAERVYPAVKLDESVAWGGWETARRALDVVDAGSGSPVDRGVVLISLLRAAGYDARPGYYRPAGAPGSAPLSVPAPALLDRPCVAVVMPGHVVWIDPSTDRVAIPELPASMVGAIAWMHGDLPVELVANGAVDGTVAIAAQLTVAGDGTSTWQATLTATGTAQEWLRTLLGPLDAQGRTTALEKLVRVGHPKLDRFTAELSGIDDPYRSLKITMYGHETGTMSRLGTSGLVGTVPPLVAPAMGAWLPPRILVREDLSITPPPAVQPLSAAPQPPVFHPDATLARTFRREGGRWVIVTEVERPYRTTSAARDSSAAAFLQGQATAGSDVLLLPAPTPDVVKSLREIPDRPPAEIAVLEALLWWNADQPKKALKAMQRALVQAGADDTVKYLARHGRADDVRPWDALNGITRDDRERLAVLRGLESTGQRHAAWLRAAPLTRSADAAVKVEALLAAERLQPATAPADPREAALWRAPDQLLAEADQVSRTLPGAPASGDPRVLRVMAARALAAGRHSDAEILLEQALQAGEDPVVLVLKAQAAAAAGVSTTQVLADIDRAVELAPFDAVVIGGASDALAQVGRRDRALHFALSSARLAFKDPARWVKAAHRSLEAGDLSTALYAARRGSDLDPKDPDAARMLELCGTLARHAEAAQLGAARAGASQFNLDGPPDLRTLMGVAPEHTLLALLQYHDTDVVKDASLLSLRAQLRLDAGQLDGAARDGALLASGFDQPRGVAIAFAASAGRLWSTLLGDLLDAAAGRDPVARNTRMEWRFITGQGDPLADAAKLRDDPRAQVMLRSISDPDGLAAEVAGWQAGADPAMKPPAGFRANKWLGGAQGVVAFSDPERGLAILRQRVPTGSLPPVLAQLYTPASPPLGSLPDGGQLVRLEGGPIPLYAAVRIGEDGTETTGLGYTPEEAVFALRSAFR